MILSFDWYMPYYINSSPRGQNGRHFADDIFICIFVNEKFDILIKISLKFVPKGPIDNKPVGYSAPSHYLNQCWPSSLTHICGTRRRWVKWSTKCWLILSQSLIDPSVALQWRHNGRDSVSNHQPHDCLLNRLFRRRSKKTSKLRVTGLCAGNSPGTGEFPAQMARNAENVSIWWRHYGLSLLV